jgi:hypothetical protein
MKLTGRSWTIVILSILLLVNAVLFFTYRVRQQERIDLRLLNSRISYVNGEIAERAFSWSALLEQLERVLPGNVKVTSLTPSVNKDGTTHLQLTCVAKDGSGVIQLLNHMLANEHFARPFPESEAKNPDGSQQFSLSVDYLPAPQLVVTTGETR